MNISELNDAISAVCPIEGINSDGVIWFKNDATEEQRQSAKTLMDENLPSLECQCAENTKNSIQTLVDILVTKGVLNEDDKQEIQPTGEPE